MYKGKKISVSIPAYNEDKYLGKVIADIPDFVDYIVVVNDASKDNTKEILENLKNSNPRLYVINSKVNEGVGASVIKAHNKGIELGAEILIVTNGDAQMDMSYSPALLDPIIAETADYTKGNRLSNLKSAKGMPPGRFIGNLLYTIIFRFLSGIKSLSDPLNGFTAISSEVYRTLDKSNLASRYEFESSMLLELVRQDKRILDVPMRSIYADEVSDVHVVVDSIKILKLLIKWFVKYRSKIHLLFGILGFIIGLLFVFLIPPFQSPDENAHYIRAAALSTGSIFCKNSEILVNRKYVAFVSSMKVEQVAHNYNELFDLNLLRNYRKEDFNEIKDSVYKKNILCYQFPLGQLIPALGIKSADILEFGPLVGFYFARILSLLVGLYLTYHAIKITPIGKEVFFVISLFPMMVNQLSSINYDALIIPLSFLFISNILKLTFEKGTFSGTYKLIITLGFILLVISLVKISYFPLIVFLLLPYIKNQAFTSKKNIVQIILMSILILSAFVFQSSINGFGGLSPVGEFNPQHQLSLLKQNPFILFPLIINSITRFFQSYFRGTIGILGWYDFDLGWYTYYFVSILSTLFLLQNNDIEKLINTLRERLVLFLVFIGCVIGVFASMYVLYTPVGEDFVGGVQGRYFLPFLPIVFLLVYSFLPKLNIRINKWVYLGGLFLIYTLVIRSILIRYYI